MNIAIIPARGGSKRIPGKNIKSFCGKPIITYSISAALESRLFDEVMVSTDDADIVGISEKYGAAIPFMRSPKASGDYATTVDVLLEVIDKYNECGRAFDNICCVYPTAPFVTAQKLRCANDKFVSSGADALIPVVAFSYPPLRGLIVEKEQLKMKWPEYEDSRSQDIETIYHDCGQFYFIKTDALLREKTLFCKQTAPFIVSELETQDIDNEDDWKLAEMKYRYITNVEQNDDFS